MVKVLLVDDEKRVRSTISGILKLHCPWVNVIGEAENVPDALNLIINLQPDIVLLDIKMQGASGFDLLKKIERINFKVIFITAFNEYAVQAFKFNAVDYLLKPVIPEELIGALNRAINKSAEDSRIQFASLQNALENQNTSAPKKIILNTQDSLHVVEIPDIIQCEADSNYTRFHLINNKQLLISKPLKDYDELLSSIGFFRCHHSHLVNLNHVERFDKKDSGSLVMKDGSRIVVSSRRTAELIAALSKLGANP